MQIMHLIFAYEVQIMNEKNKKYEKRLVFQQKIITRQSEQIENLKFEIEKLTLECQKKDEIINSVTPLRNELTENINKVKEYKKQYSELIDELKKMKKIVDQTLYKGRWKLVKHLIK